jgi:hypothetical protein
MSQTTKNKQEWALASYALQDAYTDFILSRQGGNYGLRENQFSEPKTLQN